MRRTKTSMGNHAAQLGSVAGAQGAVKHVHHSPHWSRPSRPGAIEGGTQLLPIARVLRDAPNDVPNRASGSWEHGLSSLQSAAGSEPFSRPSRPGKIAGATQPYSVAVASQDASNDVPHSAIGVQQASQCNGQSCCVQAGIDSSGQLPPHRSMRRTKMSITHHAAQLGSVAGAQGAVEHVDCSPHWSRPSRPGAIDGAHWLYSVARSSQDASNDMPSRASGSWEHSQSSLQSGPGTEPLSRPSRPGKIDGATPPHPVARALQDASNDMPNSAIGALQVGQCNGQSCCVQAGIG